MPLGIDIGATRIRVAFARWKRGRPRVEAIAVRDRAAGFSTASLIVDAWRELDTPERRCILALGMPQAELLVSDIKPKADGDSGTIVRWHSIDRKTGRYALGRTRRGELEKRLATLAETPLRAIAVDHESLALRRALPQYRIVLDIGYSRTSLHLLDRDLPRTLSIPIGGREITASVQEDLAIDAASAEKRKRIYGVSGAGEAARDRLATEIVTALTTIGELLPEQRIALVGNGALLAGFASDLCRACACQVDVPDSALLHDVPSSMRFYFGGADSNLAAGLSIWASTA